MQVYCFKHRRTCIITQVKSEVISISLVYYYGEIMTMFYLSWYYNKHYYNSGNVAYGLQYWAVDLLRSNTTLLSNICLQ